MSATKSALDKLIESTNSHWPTLTPKARAELAQLRAADIRTMEHCEECGGLLVLDADAPEDAEPFCPFCELKKARADLQAAQERIKNQRESLTNCETVMCEQARQLNEAKNNLFVMTNFCEYWLSSGRVMNGTNDLYILNTAIEASRSWLAANPAPVAEQQPDDERIDRMLNASPYENDEIAEV